MRYVRGTSELVIDISLGSPIVISEGRGLAHTLHSKSSALEGLLSRESTAKADKVCFRESMIDVCMYCMYENEVSNNHLNLL